MAQKYSDNQIPDLNADWGRDENDSQKRPYSGAAVQTFLRGRLSGLSQEMAEKGGALGFQGGRLELYDQADGRVISSVALDGTVYALSISSTTATNFYALQSDTVTTVTCVPVTQAGTIGGGMTEFIEDYDWELSVDNGSGFLPRTSGECQSGRSFSANVRNYLVTGSNRLKFSVTGKESKQTASKIFNCQLTSLSLTCNFQWFLPWHEGDTYGINNIYFSGNLEKTLYVAIDGDVEHPLTKTFSANTRYVTSPYTFDLTGYFPNDTGVHTVELWMEGGGIALNHLKWNVMTVKQEDKATAELIVMNNVKDVAKNYTDESSLFEYATYGVSEAVVNISANDGQTTYDVITDGVIRGIESEVAYGFPVVLEIESEAQTGFYLDVEIKVGEEEGQKQSAVIGIDNSNSFPSTSGALVYINPSARTNNDSNREKLINIATGDEMDATWSGMSWSKDGWVTDDNGKKCLRIEAGSTLSVLTFKPFANAQVQSASFEMLVKVQNAADYDSPILSFVDGEFSDNSIGIVLFPTQFMVQPSGMFDTKLNQRVNLSEDDMLHLVVVLHRNYSSTGRNLCQIYVNGIPNCTFEYGNVSFGNGSLKIGNPSSDINVYLLRSYNKALEYPSVVDNMLNCISSLYGKSRSQIREENDITDNGEISYDLCKAIGLNVVVWEQDTPLVSLENQTATTCNLRIEYADHPEWNVKVEGIAEDGQGTTSMKYPRWNIRHNNKVELTWLYGWNQQTKTYTSSEVGKAGYLDGGQHPKVSKMTNKKNVASSSQGHKMGATSFYNDLMKKVVGSDNLASEDARYAVYQYPFVGFVMRSDGTYEFAGLYTSGPDKTDKKTFGYGDNTMMIEGPNHAPLMTRFLVPWTNDVWYDATKKEETLKFGTEEGWDADIVGQYSSDNAAHQSAILEMYTTHFKPLYDLIYFTSPYLASLSEAGVTASSITTVEGAKAFRDGGSTNGRKNDLLSLYDTSYNLYYYHVDEKVYKKLDGHNVKTYLGTYLSANNPTTADILTARTNKFKAEIGSLMSVDEALFHKAFCLLIGATDNDAKNTYWRKVFGKLWGLNQDDLDSIFADDNNGNDTKSYSIEPQDLTEKGNEIFQGSSSAFWTRIWESYQDELGAMMKRIFNGMLDLADEYGITAPTIHETIMNVFDYYFWSKSAKYFPATCYNEDAIFAYIGEWKKNPTALYNGVAPLTQSLGDHYQTEKLWVERRIAYICSKYTIAGFEGSNADGWGTIECTLAKNHTFELTPAIDLYPAASLGGATAKRGDRTKAGEVCTLQADTDSSGSTTFYLKGLDWLEDVGDLSGMELTTRGGSDDSAIRFSVDGKRLRKLKIGDVNGGVKFNAQTVGIKGDCIEEIDARNVTSLSGALNLNGCPRLKRAYFDGTNISEFMLPEGGKVEHVEMPDNLSMLFLSNLPLLTDEHLVVDNLANIEFFYFRNTPNVNGIELLREIYNTPDNKLHFVTAYLGDLECEPSVLDMLADFVAHPFENGEGYGRAEYNGSSLSPSSSSPVIEGKITILGNVNGESLELIRENYPNLEIIYTGKISTPIHFADPEVKRICVEKWGGATGGSTGVEGVSGEMTREQAASVTSIGQTFRNNALVETFDEFEYFSSLDVISDYAFAGCANLRSIKIPKSVTKYSTSNFNGCTSLTSLEFFNDLRADVDNLAITYSFNGCTSLREFTVHGTLTLNGSRNTLTFALCENLTSIIADKIIVETSSIDTAFSGCQSLESLPLFEIRSSSVSCDTLFNNCKSIKQMPITDFGKVSWSAYMYRGCSSLNGNIGNLNLEKCTGSQSMFDGCSSVTRIGNINAPLVTSMASMFYGCSSLEEIGDIYAPSCTNCTQMLVISSSQNNILKKIGNLTFGNLNYNDFMGLRACNELVEVGDVNLEKCTNVGGYFRECTKLTKIKSLNVSSCTNTSSIFNGCSSITDWSFLDGCDFSGVTSSQSMFYNCSGLNYLPNGEFLPKIFGISIFEGTGFTFTNEHFTNVSIINRYAFTNCELPRISIFPKWIRAEAFMTGAVFKGCTTVEVVYAPKWEGYSTAEPEVFINCPTIKAVLLPSCKTIGNQVMYSGNGEVIDLGPNLVTMSNNVVRNSNISVVVRALTPPSNTANGSFFKCFYVPANALNDYKSASGWSDNASKIYAIGGEEWTEEFGSSFIYADYIKYMGEMPDLNEGKSDDDYMEFWDDEVKRICVENWGSNGHITMAQAAAVTSLGNKFQGNTTITSFDELKYMSSVTTLNSNEFNGCTALVSVDLNKVTSIGSRAFFNCENLEGVIVIPRTVTSIGVNAFSFNVVKTNKVNAVFIHKGSADLVIDDIAFEFRTTLQVIDAPSNIIQWGNRIMSANGTNVLNIVCRATTPPTGNVNDTPKAIYVPLSSVDAYKSATGWSTNASKIFAIGGSEWISEFGSADEYADYDKYGIDRPTE